MHPMGRWWPATWLALLALPAAAADPASTGAAQASAPRYPFDVALELPAQVRRASYLYAGTGGLVAPPDPGVAIPVGEQAKQAYEAVQRRAFRRGDPEAELEVHAVEADLDYGADGWSAKVVHVLVFRAPGKTIGRWTVTGRGRIVGLGHGAMPAAFERAADEAARAFERRFEEPEGVTGWLASRGVAPSPLPPPAPAAGGPAPAPARGFAAPPRHYAFYLDGAAGMFLFESRMYGASFTESAPTPSLAFRAGLTSPWFFLQYARGSTLVGADREKYRVFTHGIDAGANVRVSPELELAGGLGYGRMSYDTYDFHPVYGTLTVRESVSVAMLSLVGALHVTRAVTGKGLRLRVGLELRRHLGEARLVEANRTVDGLGPAFSAWLLLGIESPPL